MARKPRLRDAFALACLTLSATACRAAAQGAATKNQVAFHELQQDVVIADALAALRASAPKTRVLFHNVRLVDPASGAVTEGQSVLVDGRDIAWVGPATGEPRAVDATTIDGEGRFLSPGLADMHVHTNNQGDWLLDLAAGVTGVRDMAGYPWMLKAREAIDTDRMLAPTMYVAGPLINAFPLETYAISPRDPLDARRMVRQEAACGYDFIKVWNIVPMPTFDAVAEEAKAMDMDLVGHVPHDIPIRHAVEHGMRTMEHMKGFLNDATLTLGDTDYVAAVDGPEVWNTPTLEAEASQVLPRGGAAGKAKLEAPEMRYVPLRKREAWARDLNRPEPSSMVALRASQPIQRAIMTKLVGEHARFLAGTDSANYPFQVRGFALLDELALLHAAGLTPVEALRAATTEPAKAMRDEGAFGEIKAGERADLVLLDVDPTKEVDAYRRADGVMAHGYWMPRAALDHSLDVVARVYAEDDRATHIDQSSAAALVTRVSASVEAGDVFNAGEIERAADAIRSAGFVNLAGHLATLAYDPKIGPCAEVRP